MTCDWCGDEISKGKNQISVQGDNCCCDCINHANNEGKACKTNSDIERLSRNELVDLVYNLSVWGDNYDLDDVNEIIEKYRYNNQ